jgi:hypothetical protein
VQRATAAILLAGCSLIAATGVHAQTQTNVGVPGRGNGSYGVSLQHITIDKRDLDIFTENFGEVTLRSAFFEFDYGLTDRLAIDVTLPFKSNRYVGDQPHDPGLLLNDHGETLLDDGRYHSAWGDLGVNLRWQWKLEPIAITPFVGFYVPSNDYPLFTETQAGTQQWRIDVGANFAGRLGPQRLNLYWQAGYAYSYMEKTSPTDAPARRVNHSRASAEFMWRATPVITPYLSLSHVEPHNALEFPSDFTGIFVNDQWYYHDQLLPWGYTTWSLGVSYQASQRLTFSGSYGRTLNVGFGHLFEPAITINILRNFSLND